MPRTVAKGQARTRRLTGAYSAARYRQREPASSSHRQTEERNRNGSEEKKKRRKKKERWERATPVTVTGGGSLTLTQPRGVSNDVPLRRKRLRHSLEAFAHDLCVTIAPAERVRVLLLAAARQGKDQPSMWLNGLDSRAARTTLWIKMLHTILSLSLLEVPSQCVSYCHLASLSSLSLVSFSLCFFTSAMANTDERTYREWNANVGQ